MSRTRYFALCVLVLTGAFAGGYAANRTIPIAHAQDVIGPANVRGSEFTLVNPKGQVQASLRSGVAGAELALNDVNGRPRIEIGPSGGIVTRDAYGRVTWRSPKSMGVIPATE